MSGCFNGVTLTPQAPLCETTFSGHFFVTIDHSDVSDWSADEAKSQANLVTFGGANGRHHGQAKASQNCNRAQTENSSTTKRQSNRTMVKRNLVKSDSFCLQNDLTTWTLFRHAWSLFRHGKRNQRGHYFVTIFGVRHFDVRSSLLIGWDRLLSF